MEIYPNQKALFVTTLFIEAESFQNIQMQINHDNDNDD